MVSITIGTVCYILSISSPTASSSNATEKLYQIHQEAKGHASAVSTLTRHSFLSHLLPSTYSNGP